MEKKKLLWVDDEIELLRSHIIFLSEKGYEVDTAMNGSDAISAVKEKTYDLIFLDEMMAGMGGLETLGRIKEINSNIPVVMITKSEEETLMNDAIGGRISECPRPMILVSAHSVRAPSCSAAEQASNEVSIARIFIALQTILHASSKASRGLRGKRFSSEP